MGGWKWAPRLCLLLFSPANAQVFFPWNLFNRGRPGLDAQPPFAQPPFAQPPFEQPRARRVVPSPQQHEPSDASSTPPHHLGSASPQQKPRTFSRASSPSRLEVCDDGQCDDVGGDCCLLSGNDRSATCRNGYAPRPLAAEGRCAFLRRRLRLPILIGSQFTCCKQESGTGEAERQSRRIVHMLQAGEWHGRSRETEQENAHPVRKPVHMVHARMVRGGIGVWAGIHILAA